MTVSSESSSPGMRYQTRVDRAHHGADHGAVQPLETAAPPDPAVLAAIAGHDTGYFTDQLERQAHDLATQLQTQQYDLDRREADFNARIAVLENEMRTARLVQAEREIALHDREQTFQRQWNDVQRRAADVSAAELALRAERQEDRLIERTSAEQAQQALERWQRRLKELDESERQLKAQLADIAAERQRVDKDRRELHEVRAQQARQLKSECETVKAAWNTRMVKLQERSEQLERRQIAVRQLHAEVLRMYREATELRICTEELWGEISQQVSPATLTQKLGTLRRRLAEQFQLAADNLERQKKEMQTLITRLADHRATIQQQRDEVQTWLRRRQDEIEQQAARLVAREQELDRQQAEIKHLRTHWEHQRHAYEQEIRRLKQKQAVVT